MLGAIRKKSKGWVAYLIVGIITVPFALFGIQQYVGGSANSVIAVVDGEDITVYQIIDAMIADGKVVSFNVFQQERGQPSSEE